MKRPAVWLALLWIGSILLGDALGFSRITAPQGGALPGEGAAPEGILTGTLVKVIPNSSGNWTLTLENCSFTGEDKSSACGTVLAYCAEDPPARIGNTAALWGELSLFEAADNPGEFDSRAFYRGRNIFYYIEAKRLEVLDGRERPTAEAARRLRKWLKNGLEAIFDSPDTGVMAALLLGDKSSLTPEDGKAFEQGGISHILAVSGLHVSLAAGGIAFSAGLLLSLLPWQRWPGFWGRRGFLLCRGLLAGLGVWFYMLLTGCSISVQRAGLMFLLILGAAALGKSYDLASGLAAAALAVLIPCPYALYQAAFQLSFGCVLVIGCIYPRLVRGLHLDTPLGRTLLLPAVLQACMLPLTLWHYYEFHPWSLLLNLLVIPMAAYLIPLGFAAAVLAQICLPAGLMAAGPCHGALWLLRKLLALTARLPGSTLIYGRPCLWQIFLYYLLLWGGMRFLLRHQRREEESLARQIRQAGETAVLRVLREGRRGALALCLYFALLSCIFLWRDTGKMTLTSLYTGQGDCHVLELPGGGVYLLDGGRAGSSPAEKVIIPYLKFRGIRRLRAVVISHGDSDHTNGLQEVLETAGIRTDVLMMPEAMAAEAEGLRFAELARENGSELYRLAASDRWQDKDTELLVLYPSAAQIRGGNNASLVLLLRWGSFSALFPGDLETEAEPLLMKKWKAELTNITWLKAAHHGSRYSGSAAFLKLLSPEAAVISCGRGNRYGHPHEESLTRLTEIGARIFRTDLDGAVCCRVSKNGKWSAVRFREKVRPGGAFRRWYGNSG